MLFLNNNFHFDIEINSSKYDLGFVCAKIGRVTR